MNPFERARNKETAEAIALLREAFFYDPASGVLTYRRGSGSIKAGKKAGTLGSDGYWQISFRGFFFKAHRIAWALHYGRWPSPRLDHINLDKIDNRISNLREATTSQNRANSLVCGSKSGLRGVFLITDRPLRKPWGARIKSRHLGYFSTAEEAAAAYQKAALATFGDFHRDAVALKESA